MKSILMRLGIGAATISANPPSSVTAGETAEVTVEMTGGDAAQEVDDLYVTVGTEYEIETEEGTDERETTVHERRLGESFTLDADENRTETVDVGIPPETPLTRGYTDVWIEAGLDISWSLDPDDWEYVEVDPDPRMQRVFDAMDELGFDLREAYPESKPGGVFSSGLPFVQEFEYVPRTGRFEGDLDELELIFDPSSDELGVSVEVDRKGGMLSEMIGTDESVDRLVVRDQDTEELTGELANLIERNL